MANISANVDLAGNTLYVSGINGATTAGYAVTTAVAIATGITTAAPTSTTPAVFLLGTDGFGVYVGTGSPSGAITAVTGSIYLNKGGSGVSSRLWINSGGTTWTFVTTGG